MIHVSYLAGCDTLYEMLQLQASSRKKETVASQLLDRLKTLVQHLGRSILHWMTVWKMNLIFVSHLCLFPNIVIVHILCMWNKITGITFSLTFALFRVSTLAQCSLSVYSEVHCYKFNGLTFIILEWRI